ncbi:MAG: iron ABC transporter permease [Alkalinema sp. RL_2_19]|nr:iron ABC transporter permease [Alkalinema sp. RL_2_19]
MGWLRHRKLSMLGRFSLLLVLVLVLFTGNLAFGTVTIPLDAVWQSLTGQTPSKLSWATIIWQFRLPKAITAALAGAALSVSGLQMQTLFQNPLAGPSVLGVSAGASFGVAVLVLFLQGEALSLLNSLSVVAAASLGAAAVMIPVVVAARLVKQPIALLVLGLLLSYATSGVVNILLYFSVPEQIQSYLIWTFGSFSLVTWSQIPMLVTIITLGLVASLLLSPWLNVLLLGEEQAVSLGLNITQLRVMVIVNVAILTGAITGFCGPIAFLGVAVPHLARNLSLDGDHRVMMPMVMLLGAGLGLFADLVAQLPGQNTVLPLNSVMALIGTPIVIMTILRRYRR